MRGAFPDASADEKSAYEELRTWLESCSDGEKLLVRAELADVGYADIELPGESVTTDFCAQFEIRPPLDAYASFADFVAAVHRVGPLADGIAAAGALAQSLASRPDDTLAGELHVRTIGDQVVRNALSWDRLEDAPVRLPQISSRDVAAYQTILLAHMTRLDRANTQWLSEIVERDGWPTISKVGEDASRKAWLLVQHADHDPVFQLKVLRIMEPLLASEDVSARDYAYLYDRVMLKLAYRQRYGTQVTCEEGQRIALPLEDPARLDQLRTGMQLEPFAEYLTWFSVPCPTE
jgi:hypothetical protein